MTSTITVGSGKGPSAAQVENKSISTTTVDHWIPIAATATAATTPEPVRVVPDPPSYVKCIASTAAAAKATKGAKTPSQKELKSQCKQQYKTLQQEVLGFLISAQWTLAEADSLGVSVSDAEVESELSKSYPKPSELQGYLSSSHQTYADVLLRTKLNMLTLKIKQKIFAEKQPALIEKYYRENISQFSTPEKRNLLSIQTKTKVQAEAARHELEAGSSFAKVVKARSIDSFSQPNGGLITDVTKGYFAAPLGSAVLASKRGVLTGPIKSAGTFWLFEVVSITPGTRQTLKQAEPTIKPQLATTEQETVFSEFATEFKNRWTARTDCHSGYIAPNCRQYKAPENE